MVHRQAAKRDANEEAIVRALEAVGASVERLSAKGVPDLLVGFRGATYLLEVKMPAGRLSSDQVAWHAAWRGQVSVVRCEADAYAAIGCVTS